jgi:SRSO17 transposase
MNENELRALGPTLADYLHCYLFCCDYTQTFAHLGTYTRGLLSDLKRKTAQDIAMKGGTPVRTMQEFLRDHVWDEDRVKQLHQQHTKEQLAAIDPGDDLGTIGLIDETSAQKKGTKTPGVKRQHLGCVGKIENGIVTVHLGVNRGRYKCLIDDDLFLPEDWSNDRPRCREAGIPDSVIYRPKWKIALEQIARARGNGVVFDWMTFDEGYGKSPEFIFALDADARKLPFVGEVPKTLSCLAVNRSGERPQKKVKGRHAEEVVRSGSLFRSQSWQVYRLPRETMQDQVWRVKAARVWLHSKKGWSEKSYWLIWASNDETGEEKFFLSNAPPDAKIETLVRVAFRRWNVEHSFRVAKGELGFADFEGRNYTALLRHMSLCLVAMGFAAEHTERLRKKNPDITLEQVCRALRVLCRGWLQRQRGSSEDEYDLTVIEYHQARNATATRSKKKRSVTVRDRKKPRPRRQKRQTRSTTRAP